MEMRATSRTSSGSPPSSPQTAPADRAPVPDSGEPGTRSLAEIASRAGYFMGTRLTPARDSWDLIHFFEKWINRYLSHTRWLHTILEQGAIAAEPPTDEMERDFTNAI